VKTLNCAKLKETRARAGRQHELTRQSCCLDVYIGWENFTVSTPVVFRPLYQYIELPALVSAGQPKEELQMRYS